MIERSPELDYIMQVQLMLQLVLECLRPEGGGGGHRGGRELPYKKDGGACHTIYDYYLIGHSPSGLFRTNVNKQ